jgi:hypothetical protein
MRANKIMRYESILQVLGETGCQFCRFMKKLRKQLVEELTHLRDEYQPDTAKWGVLGHAAEFLAS